MPKLELESDFIGTRLRILIQTEMTLKFEVVYLWTDSRVVLDWVSSNKKKTFSSRIDSLAKKLRKQLKLMSGIISQLILTQTTMERVALSHQKSPEMAYSIKFFARH